MKLTGEVALARGRAMADRYRQGASLRQIGAEFGISHVAVYFGLRRLHVARRSKGRPSGIDMFDILVRLLNGEPASSIAFSLGRNRGCISKMMQRRGLSHGDLKYYRRVLLMSDEAKRVMRETLRDGKMFWHAYELAQEYQPQRRAA